VSSYLLYLPNSIQWPQRCAHYRPSAMDRIRLSPPLKHNNHHYERNNQAHNHQRCHHHRPVHCEVARPAAPSGNRMLVPPSCGRCVRYTGSLSPRWDVGQRTRFGQFVRTRRRLGLTSGSASGSGSEIPIDTQSGRGTEEESEARIVSYRVGRMRGEWYRTRYPCLGQSAGWASG